MPVRRRRSGDRSVVPVARRVVAFGLDVMVSTGAAPAPIQGPLEPVRHNGTYMAKPPQAEASRLASTTPVIFDNFNRTSSSGWGNGWSTNVIPSQCPGYSTSVDGASGLITDLGAGGCFPEDAYNARPSGAWKELPRWQFTGKFKVSALDGGIITFRVREDFVIHGYLASASMRFSSTGGIVDNSACACGAGTPYPFTANTWYWLKWVHAWGDQDRVTVWPVSEGEPAGWTLSRDASGEDVTAELPGSWFEVGWEGPGSSTAYFDDFGFATAPILPKVPPPPGTDHNPPFTNEDAAGDPVNTATGTFSTSVTDVSIPGRGPAVAFVRSYNSNDTRATSLGPGWTHSYNVRLNSPGDGTADVILVGPQGRSDRYTESGGAFTPPLGVYRSLVQNADGTIVTRRWEAPS